MSYENEYMEECEELEHDAMHTVQYYDKSFQETQIDPNVQETQIDPNVELTQEQNMEGESCTMRYQNVESLIQTEIKELIFKKETEKTTFVILNEHNSDLMRRIQHLQELKSKVVEENEYISVNTEIEKEEYLNLQKRITYDGEIVGRLKQFMETIEKSFEQLKVRNRQLARNITEQLERISKSRNIHEDKIAKLKRDINNSNLPVKDDNDPLKKENTILKSKLVELQGRVKNLKEHRLRVDVKRERVDQLVKEKGELKHRLESKKCELKELTVLRDNIKTGVNEYVKLIELNKEEKNKELDDATQTMDEINSEISRIKEEKENGESVLLQKEKRKLQLEEDISKILKDTDERRVKLNAYEDKCKHEIATAQERVKKTEIHLTEMNKKNEVLSCDLEQAKRDYMAKMEEKSGKLLVKLNTEKKFHSNEVLLTTIKLIEEQIMLKSKKRKELSEKLDDLSSEQTLQDLNKKKAYLISSRDYLAEKLENVRGELEKENSMVKDLQNDIDFYKQSNKTTQGKINDLARELQEQKDSANIEVPVLEETHRSVTPTSILKSTLSYKKCIASPKKVQFEGLSSFESSSNSEAVNCSQSPKQGSIMGKTFDDLLQEIQAESFKKPVKVAKKRKMDFE